MSDNTIGGVNYDLVDELFSSLEELLPVDAMDELEEALEAAPAPSRVMGTLGNAYRLALESLQAARVAALLAAGAHGLPRERREELVAGYATLVRGTQEGFRAYLVPWPLCLAAFNEMLESIARQADAYAGQG